MKTSIIAGAALAAVANAQSGAWGQCGGNGWTGRKLIEQSNVTFLGSRWLCVMRPQILTVTSRS